MAQESELGVVPAPLAGGIPDVLDQRALEIVEQ
jgi:hypothetical protein